VEKFSWKTLPLGPGVELLRADENGLAAFTKPAGVLSHPNRISEQPRSLLNARYVEAGQFFELPGPGARNGPGSARGSRADSGGSPESSDDRSAVGEPPTAAREPRALPGSSNPTSLASASAPPRRIWLLNRLDSATSGVILAAASEKLAREIRALFQQRQVRKLYNALVFGVPSEPRQIWRDRLAVEKRGAQIRTAAGRGVPSEAHMRVLAQKRPPSAAGAPLALIQLEPKTGRSHQLRVQCAQRGLPIVGDATYGDFAANRAFAQATGEKRLFLHSLETSFTYTWAGRDWAFSAKAPLPPEFIF
jgi:23S rRNA-/tRNA-specific pseudouridylate synthase